MPWTCHCSRRLVECDPCGKNLSIIVFGSNHQVSIALKKSLSLQFDRDGTGSREEQQTGKESTSGETEERRSAPIERKSAKLAR